MNNRRKQLVKWAVDNFDQWPAPLDTNPEGPCASEIVAEWTNNQIISSLPILRCKLGGGQVTSVDWFYMNKENRGGAGRGQGRKPVADTPTKPYTVTLDDATVEKARVIGDGNLSKGLRVAVDAYQIAGADNAEVRRAAQEK